MAGQSRPFGEGVTIMMVRNCLDVNSLDLGTLCTHDNLNEHSRYRPGYWSKTGSDTYNGSVVTYIKPLGNDGTLDPRGVDEYGITKRLYKLTDFFRYNHNATPYQIFGGEEQELVVQSDVNTITTEVNFILGEVDWFNDETIYNGKNHFGEDYNYFVIYRKNEGATDFSPFKAIHKDARRTESSTTDYFDVEGFNKRVIFEIELNTPMDSTYDITTEFRFGLGISDVRINSYFDTTLAYSVTKKAQPVVFIQVSEEGLTNLKDSIAFAPNNIDKNDLRGAQFIPDYQYLVAIDTDTVTIKSNLILDFFYNYCKVISPGAYRIGGTLKFDRKGTIQTSNFEAVFRYNGDFLTSTIDLPATAIDGDVYTFICNTFSNTSLEIYNPQLE